MLTDFGLEELRTLGIIFLAVVVLALFFAALLFLLTVRHMRRINIPPDATFVQTLRLTPLAVVLMVDLLDLALDFLAAPVAWVLLDRLGLRALRNVSTIEALIPGTQLLPTLTAAWFAVRILRID